MENVVPISMNIIQPIIKSNILYVNSIEEFEKIELDCNEVKIAFDNFRQRFYFRSRNCYGEYSDIKVFFYENFPSKMNACDNKEFYEQCKELKLDPLKTEIAYKFFIENEKPQAVWLWLLETKKVDYAWDTVKHLRWKLKKAFLSLEDKN